MNGQTGNNIRFVISAILNTKTKSGAIWGYYLNGSEDKTSFEFGSVTDSVYNNLGTDKTVELKQGENVFYISGNNVTCKMHFEVSEIDMTKVSYVGANIKELAQEQAKKILN